MDERVFCIGNGESRSPVDLIRLRPHGKIYGCNGLYRDFTPDVLTVVDGPMMHEVYQSGYCDENKVYFRDWDDLPGDTAESMIDATKTGMKDPKISEWKSNPEGFYQNFVIHGSSTVNKDRQNNRWKGDGFESVYVTWTYGLADQNITLLKNIMNDYYAAGGWEADNAGPEDPGWSSGATAMYIACKVEKPKKCYLIGMDMYSTTDFINNLYKGTYGYLGEDEGSITPQNWVIQMGRVMVRYQDIQFIKVNPDESNRVSERMPQWDSLPNLSYMKKSEFYAKLSLDF